MSDTADVPTISTDTNVDIPAVPTEDESDTMERDSLPVAPAPYGNKPLQSVSDAVSDALNNQPIDTQSGIHDVGEDIEATVTAPSDPSSFREKAAAHVTAALIGVPAMSSHNGLPDVINNLALSTTSRAIGIVACLSAGSLAFQLYDKKFRGSNDRTIGDSIVSMDTGTGEGVSFERQGIRTQTSIHDSPDHTVLGDLYDKARAKQAGVPLERDPKRWPLMPDERQQVIRDYKIALAKQTEELQRQRLLPENKRFVATASLATAVGSGFAELATGGSLPVAVYGIGGLAIAAKGGKDFWKEWKDKHTNDYPAKYNPEKYELGIFGAKWGLALSVPPLVAQATGTHHIYPGIAPAALLAISGYHATGIRRASVAKKEVMKGVKDLTADHRGRLTVHNRDTQLRDLRASLKDANNQLNNPNTTPEARISIFRNAMNEVVTSKVLPPDQAKVLKKSLRSNRPPSEESAQIMYTVLDRIESTRGILRRFTNSAVKEPVSPFVEVTVPGAHGAPTKAFGVNDKYGQEP